MAPWVRASRHANQSSGPRIPVNAGPRGPQSLEMETEARARGLGKPVKLESSRLKQENLLQSSRWTAVEEGTGSEHVSPNRHAPAHARDSRTHKH